MNRAVAIIERAIHAGVVKPRDRLLIKGCSETGKPPAEEPTNLPFVRPAVRQIIEGLFRERAHWKSGELVDRVV